MNGHYFGRNLRRSFSADYLSTPSDSALYGDEEQEQEQFNVDTFTPVEVSIQVNYDPRVISPDEMNFRFNLAFGEIPMNESFFTHPNYFRAFYTTHLQNFEVLQNFIYLLEQEYNRRLDNIRLHNPNELQIYVTQFEID